MPRPTNGVPEAKTRSRTSRKLWCASSGSASFTGIPRSIRWPTSRVRGVDELEHVLGPRRKQTKPGACSKRRRWCRSSSSSVTFAAWTRRARPRTPAWIAARRAPAARSPRGRRGPQTFELGDVDGVLENEGDVAAVVEDGGVGRAPEALFERRSPAAASARPGTESDRRGLSLARVSRTFSNEARRGARGSPGRLGRAGRRRRCSCPGALAPAAGDSR